MATIYRKTAKGQTEIETRAHHLTPRLRTPLIMIDGRRSDEELRKLVAGQPDEILQTLLEQGFIEVAAQSAPAARSAPAQAANESKPPSTLPSESKPPGASFKELRRLAVRSLTDQLGPAAEGVALKIERTRNAEELRPLLLVARDVLGNARGAQAAAAFHARFIAPPAP